MAVRVKQIAESDINLDNGSTVITISDGKLVNDVKMSSEVSPNSIPVYGTDGSIKVSDPSTDSDAVSLSYLNNALTNAAFPGFLDSSNIVWSIDSETKKYVSSLDTAHIRSNSILKIGDGNRLVSTSYIYEDVDNGRTIVSKYSQRIGSSVDDIAGTTFSIESDKQSNGNKSELAVITSSDDLQYGPTISTFAFKNYLTGRGSVLEGQKLFEFNVNGASVPSVTNVFKFNVISDSDFTNGGDNLSHISVLSNGEEILSTNVDNDIRVSNGLIVGDTTTELPGAIRFNPDAGHFQGWNGTGWIPLDDHSGNSSTQSDITSTISVGGIQVNQVIPTGTTIEDFITKLVSPFNVSDFYIDFGMTTSLDTGDNLEIGQEISVVSAYIESNDDIVSVTINGNGFDSSTEYIPNEGEVLATETSATFRVPLGKTEWSVVAKNTVSNTTDASFSINGCYRFAFGGSTTNYAEAVYSPDIDSLMSNFDYELTDDFMGSGLSVYTGYYSEDDYFFFAYPSEWGRMDDGTYTHNIFMHGVPIFDTFTYVGEYEYTNVYDTSIKTMYNLYQSNNPGAFRAHTKITFK